MDRLLGSHLADWALKTPDAPAFEMGSDVLRYQDLSDGSDRLAQVLIEIGVAPGDRVGIYMDQCLDMPLAVYAILKAGGVYVPLDPGAAPSRTALILNDCQIKVVLSHAPKAGAFSQVLEEGTGITDLIGLTLEGVRCHAIGAQAGETRPLPERAPSDHAYILFTSGSTGTPKGMLHTHQSGVSYVEMVARLFDLSDTDRIGNHSPLHFDVAMLSVFGIISRGGTGVLIPEVLTKLPASLSQLIETSRLTVWYSVPFALIQLLEYGALEKRDLSALRWVIYAGAPMSNRHLAALQLLLKDARFSNAYGPAEANQVTYYHLPPGPHPIDLPVPIGYACDHTDLAFDGDELLVATPAMMEGYWGRKDLDDASFVMRDGKRFYRTGDVVSKADDGALTYLGRKDRQVKVRGVRIELDEVELAISAHPAVSEVSVIVSEDGLTLEGFVTSSAGHKACEREVLEGVRGKLSGPFVPSKITVLEAFERTPTGKIDRNTLRKTES